MWNNYWVCSVEDKNPDKNCFSEMVKPESDRQNVRERRWQSKCSELFQKFICKEQRSWTIAGVGMEGEVFVLFFKWEILHSKQF